MSVKTPDQLVDEFKKSGEFDRLRRELLSQFKNDESIGSFMERVQEIVQQRLHDDAKLQYMPAEAVHTELMQEMDRYPLVERAIADLPMLSDPSFNAGIRKRLDDLVKAKPQNGKASTRRRSNATKERSDSSESASSDQERRDEYAKDEVPRRISDAEDRKLAERDRWRKRGRDSHKDVDMDSPPRHRYQ